MSKQQRFGFGSWWRRLAKFMDSSPAAPSSALPIVVAREWLPSHQAEFQTFLMSTTGTTLMQRMQAVAAVNARHGAADAMTPAHSAGRTTGFYDAIQWLDSQARIEHAPRTISGADADQSATSAHQLPGEAELREALSP